MSKKRYAVAIDGPSGAGKSTLARAVAERLGILYVDTGAIYRTIGLYVQRCGVDPKDAPAVLALLPEVHIGMDHDADGVQRMLLSHLHDLGHAVGVRQQRVQFFIQLRHAADLLSSSLQGFFQMLYQRRTLRCGHHTLEHGGQRRHVTGGGLLCSAAQRRGITAGQHSQQSAAIRRLHHRTQRGGVIF